jgi:PTS system N-acetylglucosamine-specific IIC component
MKQIIARLQPMGRALMLPIAVLPVAALLLRLGQPDLLGVPAIAAAGDAVFSNLGLLFAIGVAVGLARENHGAAGLAAVVGYLVATNGAKALISVSPQDMATILKDMTLEQIALVPDTVKGLAMDAFRAKELSKLSVPIGLITGLLSGWAYNRFSDIRLPSYLAFFGGRRFVPIVCGVAGVLLALIFGYSWHTLAHGMDEASKAVLASGSTGVFLYGVLNRALIVTGLHHIINNLAWFQLGEFKGFTGDLTRFLQRDPTAGAFMSGFFPVMMFGLPGACLAMYRAARPEKRKAVGGMLLSMALTSFLTGVTEPIEFSFMFLAPLLFAIHALLTGIAMSLMDALGVHLGFSFSAGLFDYVINFSKSTRPWLLIPVGLGYFALYYGLFRYFIVRFDLKTLGRETEDSAPQVEGGSASAPVRAWIKALGDAGNLRAVEACTTRLRLVLADVSRIDEPALKALGSRGVLRIGDGAVQVVVGPVADQLASEIRAEVRSGTAPSAVRASVAPVTRTGVADPNALAAALAALGGRKNIAQVHLVSSRLCVTVSDPAAVDENALAKSVRALARPAPGSLHLVLGPASEAWYAELKDS